MNTSTPTSDSMANQSPSLIPLPKGDVLARQGDSLLQLLAVTAYWGKHSKTGRELWAELRRIIDSSSDRDSEISRTIGLSPDLNTTEWTVERLRNEVGNVTKSIEDPTESALQVATQASNSARVFRLERLRQVRWIFALTFGSSVLGILLMIVGVFSEVNMVMLGVFVEFISGALLLLYRSATRQLDSEAEVSFELERLRIGITLIREIHDTAVRDQALRSLIQDLHEHPSTIAVDSKQLKSMGAHASHGKIV